MALAFAIGVAMFQTITSKKRNNQNRINLGELIINCSSTIGNVLFGSAIVLTLYLLAINKTRNVIHASEQFYEIKIINVLFLLAFLLKVPRILHFISMKMLTKNLVYKISILLILGSTTYFLSICNIYDIFFIDWETHTSKSANKADASSICSNVYHQMNSNNKKIPFFTFFFFNSRYKNINKMMVHLQEECIM